MNNYLSFDIELYTEMPDENQSLADLIPSTAALCTNYEDVEYFDDNPYMSKATANKLVDKMLQWHTKGYDVLTWNGLSFDLHLLGLYSERVDDCARIALNHYDMMFMLFSHKGFYLGLEKALKGANIETKLHEVTLNNGETLKEMNGSKAPLLWRAMEFSAVRDYLRVDVEQPIKLARHIESTKTIKWISNSGKWNTCFTDMLTVNECLKLPPPDQSWMKDPKVKESFYSWIPETILKSEGVIA